MKLDKRIKRGKKPLTPLDIEKAYGFIGKLCLFSNYASCFENFDLVDPRIDFYQLSSINEKDENDCPFHGIGIFTMHDFRYCLPADWIKIKELKYRVNSLEQCFNDLTESKENKNEQRFCKNTEKL